MALYCSAAMTGVGAAVLHTICPAARSQELLVPVAHIRNPHLRERHWSALCGLLQRRLVDHANPSNTTTIADLVHAQACPIVPQ
jgi:hypothetical protein